MSSTPGAVVVRGVTVEGVRLEVASLDPAALGLVVARGSTARAAHPLSGAEALRLAAGAAVVLDGPMFHGGGSRTARTRFRLLDRGRGIDWPSESPEKGSTLSVDEGGGVSVRDGAELAPGARVAVQCYPTLAVDGASRPVADSPSNRERVWRAALALAPTGRVLFIVGVASLERFAAALATMGVRWAGYTDGGSSTDLRTRAGPRWGYPQAPSVPVWLSARGSLDVPGVPDLDRSTFGPLALLGLVAVGAVIVATSDSPSDRAAPAPPSDDETPNPAPARPRRRKRS